MHTAKNSARAASCYPSRAGAAEENIIPLSRPVIAHLSTYFLCQFNQPDPMRTDTPQ